MSLRFQLLALCAITLLLPWAGLEMVRQVEASLRLGLEQSLLDRARANIVVTRLAESEALRRRAAGPRTGRPLYLDSLSRPPLLDGFRRDWAFARDPSGASTDARTLTFDDGSRLWLGVNSSYVYLFADVVDDELVYQGVPGEAPHGDRIALLLGGDTGGVSTLLLASSAPGPFRAQLSDGDPRFVSSGGYYDVARGNWQETAGRGYTIEARLPLRLVQDGLGIGIIDSDDGGSTARLAAATWGETAEPSALVRESPELNSILKPFAGGEDRLRILDPDGFVLADSGPLRSDAASAQGTNPSIMERFFRYVLRRDDPEYASQELRPGKIADPALTQALAGQPATAWYRRGADVSAIVAAAVPIDPYDARRGVLLLEQASDPIVTVANRAMMRVVATTLIMSFLLAAAALAYAGFLSFRVGRLARAAESALGPRGEIRTRLPGAKSRDAIGHLSRSFEDLLRRLRDYTEYLQSLKSKLGHELRTPLAIVATSLDNLEHELERGHGTDYLDRLRHGTDRLEAILQAMTAATRVEQAIAQSDLETFDIRSVVASCIAAYGDVYKDLSFEAQLPEGAVLVDGSAELVEQMMDKLVDNAAGFASEGSAIEVALAADSREVWLSIVNRGPPLPEAMRHQLFDSLVSVRASQGDKPHLGLGLYIVMLIVDFHRGRVEAENLADGSGVRISVTLPITAAKAPS